MSTDETYNGWANRETWAVALHINNDQGWQESVREALREARQGYREDNDESVDGAYESRPYLAGEVIREDVEDFLESGFGVGETYAAATVTIMQDIGSLWRVDWTELGAAFLADLAEQGDA